jgi:hypothetical protein
MHETADYVQGSRVSSLFVSDASCLRFYRHKAAWRRPAKLRNPSKADGFQKNRCKLCQKVVSMAYRLRKGLGQDSESDYMSDCTGPNPNCGPQDTLCVVNWSNTVEACQQQYVTDPNSPHNLVGSTEAPAQLVPGSAAWSAQVAAAGGSEQEAEQAVGESVPSGVNSQTWWSQPGATITASSSAPPASSPATVTQSSAPPSSTPAIVTQSSAPPASSGAIVTQSSAPPSGSAPPASSSGFDLSSIPWWGWLAAAGVAFLALKK